MPTFFVDDVISYMQLISIHFFADCFVDVSIFSFFLSAKLDETGGGGEVLLDKTQCSQCRQNKF